jgi:transcriptional regulator with XRE-family HTH domain
MDKRTVDKVQAQTLIAINDVPVFAEMMGLSKQIGARIEARLEEISLSKADAARRCGWSAQRFGNYSKGEQPPGAEELIEIARALRTSTDWLLGISSSEPIDVAAVIARLLEIDGMEPARAAAIAETVAEALQVLSALPGDGDAAVRSQIAAQAAWQLRGGAKQSQ